MSQSIRLFVQEIGPLPQAAMLALMHKGLTPTVDFEVIPVPNTGKSPEFLALSPTGKAPMLVLDGEAIFETVAILEAIDGHVPGPSLQPEHPLKRASHVSWQLYTVDLLFATFAANMAPDAQSYGQAIQTSRGKLQQVEDRFGQGPYFYGESLASVDFLMATLFQRLALFEARYGMRLLTDMPKLQSYAQALSGLEHLAASLPPHFEDVLFGWMDNCGSYMAQQRL